MSYEKAIETMLKARIDNEKLTEALKEYNRFNRIHNDLEAYLFELGQWALGEVEDKPNRQDYGIEI